MIQKAFKHIILLFTNPKASYFRTLIPIRFYKIRFQSIRTSNKQEPYKILFKEPLIVKIEGDDREILNHNSVSYSNRTPVLPPVYLHRIKNGVVYPDTGTIEDSQGFLIIESQKNVDVFHNRSLLHNIALSINNKRYINGDCAVLVTQQGMGFGHFVLDHLPRLYALNQYDKPFKLLIPDNLMPVLKELVEWLKPELCEIVYVDISKRKGFRCNQILLPSFTTIGGFGYWREEIRIWVNQGIDRVLGSNQVKDKLLYISRRKAKYGYIIDEDLLEKKLKERGVDAICLEDFSLMDQIKLIREAKFICGSQSSGFANLAFASNSTVLQILWKLKVKSADGTENWTCGLYDFGTCLSSNHKYHLYTVEHGVSIREPLNIDHEDFLKKVDIILGTL